MITTLRSDSFHLVGEQVAATLRDAHAALESYAEGDTDPQSLQTCADLLHVARGALQITEIYGASLLAEEMEFTCRYLADGKHTEQLVNEGVEALSRAIIQLPAYVERIMSGGRDIPLVLLPLLNDLRAARGNPLLSESTLLLLNVAPPTATQKELEREPSGEDIGSMVGKLRPQFQLGLLGWIKGGDVADHLRRMAKVAEHLEKAARLDEVHQLWWVVGGILEALAADGLEASVALKRLIGQADREIKRLQELGEEAYAAEPPTDLVNNLLYYVARSKEGGPRCAGIRAAFNLSGFGPGDEQVEELREQLSAPSARLMKTVADAIREDLGKAKDVLDIYVRTGMRDSSELEVQVGLLRKISDTLGVLGLGALREIVQQRSEELDKIASSPDDPQEPQLVALAAALLEVESRLTTELIHQVNETDAFGEEDEQRADDSLTDAEFRQVTSAVLRECIVNLAQIKESITQVLAQPSDSYELDALDDQLRGISAGLVMLGKTRAVDLLNRIGAAIRRCVISALGATDAESMNRLADSIVSLEYYMETMKAGRKEPVYMLDNAERSLESIEDSDAFMVPEPLTPASHTQTLKIGTEQLEALPDAPVDFPLNEDDAVAVMPDQAERSAADLARTAIIEAPVLDMGDAHPDPELIEVFLEEAKEEIAAINRHFPTWADDQRDEEALITVRRSFHTLKGSGRMVGAVQLGEYAWNIENLLNKVINKTIEVSAPLLMFIADAIDVLPELLEQLEAGAEPQADVGAIAQDAVTFSEGQLPLRYKHVSLESDQRKHEEPAFAGGEPAEQEAVGIDPVLLEILGRETTGHLEAIRKFLADCAASSDALPISEEMHHACHTLHGSVTMANATAAGVLTGPLYQMIEPLYRRKQGMDDDQLALFRAATDLVEQVVGMLVSGEGELPDTMQMVVGVQSVADQISDASDILVPESVSLDLPNAGESDTADVDASNAQTTDFDLPASAEERAPEPEFDAEIAAIFAEEAAEILEAADAAVALLGQNAANTAPLEELQRHLHTLKGGARMAGITTMGDFSHELESLLIRINHGGAGLDEAAFSLLQASVDELHSMRDQVTTGIVRAPAAELSSRLARAADATLAPAVKEPELPAEPPEDVLPGDAVSLEAAAPEEEAVDEVAPDQSSATMLVPEPDNLGELARELTRGEPPAEPSGELPADLVAGTQQVPVPDLQPRKEMARVDSAMLEELLNNAGEISIAHSRMNQQVSSLQFNLEELNQTVRRLQGQLRKLEIETEAQILFRHQADAESNEEFDPLELDRYSTIQQLSRGLAETASDVSSIKDLLQNITADTESILLQQARTTSELQDTLMRTRMVPFDQHVPRLTRLVRQQAQEAGKQVELLIEGTRGELDRQVMEKMLPPFEHMLRNAIIHGIEAPEARVAAGKAHEAKIVVRFEREGSQVLIEVQDDGAGLDLDKIKEKALEAGVIKQGQSLTDEEASQLILRSGLSTADKLTQSAGRGIGMDVVVSEIAKLGGTLAIDTTQGKGCKFTVRLPYTLAITQAFIVKAGPDTYAIPLPSVEGVVRLSSEEFAQRMGDDEPSVEYGGRGYRLRPLGQYLGMGATRLASDTEFVSLILVDAGKNSTALITDEAAETREIVVKPISPMLAGIRGIAGATILGDGRVVVILDTAALVRSPLEELAAEDVPRIEADDDLPPLALVVDDSITMRRVTQRLLERNGMRVITAKDGLEAVEVLQDHEPEIIILDVEMPRMDGYEFASHVRNTAETVGLPIIMVTSRTGEKHRARAIEIGVNDYLGKPYQEFEMLDAIKNLLGKRFSVPESQRDKGPRH